MNGKEDGNYIVVSIFFSIIPILTPIYYCCFGVLGLGTLFDALLLTQHHTKGGHTPTGFTVYGFGVGLRVWNFWKRGRGLGNMGVYSGGLHNCGVPCLGCWVLRGSWDQP